MLRLGKTFILHDPFSLFCQVYIQNKPLLPIFLCRTDVNDVTHRADAIQRQLRDLQGSRNNKLKLFGSWVPDLLQRVEQAERRGKFHQKPVGPIGNTLFFFSIFFLSIYFFYYQSEGFKSLLELKSKFKKSEYFINFDFVVIK